MAGSESSSLAEVRVFSYSIAGVLGLLLASSATGPIFSARSERAIINAPVELITAPIDGILTEMSLEPDRRGARRPGRESRSGPRETDRARSQGN